MRGSPGAQLSVNATYSTGLWEFYDCYFVGKLELSVNTTNFGLKAARCYFKAGTYGLYCYWWKGNGTPTYGIQVECCYFQGHGRNANVSGAYIYGLNGARVIHCTFNGFRYGTYFISASNGQVYNCILDRCQFGIYSNYYTVSEGYNTFIMNDTPKTNCIGGVQDYEDVGDLWIDRDIGYGFRLPKSVPTLMEYYWFNRCTSAPEEFFDLYGTPIPTYSYKRYRGAIQPDLGVAEYEIVYGDSQSSLKLVDAGVTQLVVPCNPTQTKVSVRAYTATGYTGSVPRMTIKQPGQSDRNTEFGSEKGEWMQVIDVFTPGANVGYFIVELENRNTNIDPPTDSWYVVFDDLEIKEL
jgi:hypothetical protein